MTSSLFLSLADAAAAPTGPNSLFSSPIVPFAAMLVMLYFLMIRPQSKRQKELQALVSALKTGDKVVTNSGIHGVIANVKEGSTLSLKIADNVKIEIDKSSIASVDKGSSSSSSSAS